MSRKKVEINKERGKRLRQLLLDRGMDQSELADKLNYTKEHISYVVNGHRNLTQDMAEAIVKIFPDVRVGWLLGIDKHMTNLDIIAEKGDTVLSCICAIEDVLKYSAFLLGYNVVEVENDSAKNCKENVQEYELNKSYWILTDSKSQTITITLSDYLELRDEVLRYSKFLLEGIIYRANNSWHPLSITPEDIK